MDSVSVVEVDVIDDVAFGLSLVPDDVRPRSPARTISSKASTNCLLDNAHARELVPVRQKRLRAARVAQRQSGAGNPAEIDGSGKDVDKPHR